MKQINQLMNRLRFIVFAILFFSPKLYAENYVDNISGISNLAENTVKALYHKWIQTQIKF